MSTENSIESYPTDNDKRLVQTGKENKVTGFVNPDFAYSITGRFIIFRLMRDRDVKITVTSKGKTTGTGKTMLALDIARFTNRVRNQLFDMNKIWTAKEYAFMDVYEYLQKYSEADPGDPLITDELEYLADRRRSMSNQNVNFSKAWSMLRYRNVVTIGTAPGLSDLDKRIPEATDIWINVIHKGKANPYYMTVNDFEWTREFKRLRKGKYRESILWNPIESDEDYKWLANQKEEIGVPGIDDSKEKSVDESDLNSLERNLRNNFLKNVLKFLDEKNLMRNFTQEEIAEMANVSQPQVSKFKREMEKEGEITA